MKKVFSVQLKVAEARQRDVGKKRARISSDAMRILDMKGAEVVEIRGKRVTAATAWAADPEDEGLGLIRIDGQTRKNASVALNEYAVIRKADVKAARTVTLVPMNTKLLMDRDFSHFIKSRLQGVILHEGDEISIIVLGNPMVFKLERVRPKAIVRIEVDTILSILPEPFVEKKPSTRVSYEEIGGLKNEISRLREIVELPLRHPEVFQRLGIEPPNGILLYGPPGCGKTLIAKGLANESEASFYIINGPEIMNKYYGETEARLREIFKEARENSPSIIFIDEIDAIAPRREETFGDVEKRVVAQLLALMDGVSERGNTVVMGATNRIDGVDPALRRPGRFDREVEIGVPNAEGKLEILQIHIRGMPISSDVDLKRVADECYGYTGADIRALCREAALKALRRHLPQLDLESERIPPKILEKMQVTSADIKEAFKEIVPTAMREFYVEMPSVGWNEIGGHHEVKQILQENVVWPVRDPGKFKELGVKPPRGLLLYGPPGCGKTLLARALAKETGANFISVRGPEILSKWVGESEKAVREIFRKAKASAPCLVFFDEVDSIAKPRGEYSEDGGHGERLLSQLLTEIDTSYLVGDVFVIAVTNRPNLVDPSLLRPGRLDLQVYVPPPDEVARKQILTILTSKMPLSPNIPIDELAAMTRGYSGADLESLCRESAISAMRRIEMRRGRGGEGKVLISASDIREALGKVKPSITPEMQSWYESAYKKMTGGFAQIPGKEFYG